MKIEKLNMVNGKKMFIVGLVLGITIIIILNLFTSKAKYQNTQSVKIVEGKVNYILPDLNVVAVYLKKDKEYLASKEIPKTGYTLNKNDSYCLIPDNKEQIKNTLEFNNGKLTVDITKKGTKCFLYFDSSANLTLAKLNQESKGEIGKINGPSCIDEDNTGCGNNDSINMNQNGIYTAGEDDDGVSYIYRGTINNNWVKFGQTIANEDIWWRIIRINGDGSLRLIYSGTTTENNKPSPTGENTQIGTSMFNTNEKYNTYVGYYYGDYESDDYYATHSNNFQSEVATKINAWFSTQTKLSNETYIKQIDENAGFCNDRQISSSPKEWWRAEEDNNRGTGSVITAYGSLSRYISYDNQWLKEPKPTLKCANKNNDLFTIKTSNQGNQILDYPVGLITADEVVLAGGIGHNTINYNTNYWLYTENSYWTMTPVAMYSNNIANVFTVNGKDISFRNIKVNSTHGIRPVINLKSNITFTFEKNKDTQGTINNPYVVN